MMQTRIDHSAESASACRSTVRGGRIRKVGADERESAHRVRDFATPPLPPVPRDQKSLAMCD